MKLTFDARMPRALHVALVNFLQTQLNHPRECDGALTRTRAFLSSRIPDPEAALAWLTEHGGYCDCEVIMNTHPDYGCATDPTRTQAS
jgi:hypothetical protein